MDLTGKLVTGRKRLRLRLRRFQMSGVRIPVTGNQYPVSSKYPVTSNQ